MLSTEIIQIATNSILPCQCMLWLGEFIWNNTQANISLCFVINNVFTGHLELGIFDKTLLSGKLSENAVSILFVCKWKKRNGDNVCVCWCVCMSMFVFRQFDKYIIAPSVQSWFLFCSIRNICNISNADHWTYGKTIVICLWKVWGHCKKQQQPLTKTLAQTELIHQHRDLTLNRSLSYILILCVKFVMFGFLHAFNGSAQ